MVTYLCPVITECTKPVRASQTTNCRPSARTSLGGGERKRESGREEKNNRKKDKQRGRGRVGRSREKKRRERGNEREGEKNQKREIKGQRQKEGENIEIVHDYKNVYIQKTIYENI